MDILLSERPCDAYADEMRQFGRLVRRWETRISFFPDDSPARQAEGEWEFGYALEGRAVIDVWQVPKRSDLAGASRSSSQECGLCVRVWDPRLRLWRFTFHGTARGDVIHMFGREVDGDMVMERADDGDLVRWVFFDVGEDSFSWHGRRSGDGGRSWRLEQEVQARRITFATEYVGR